MDATPGATSRRPPTRIAADGRWELSEGEVVPVALTVEAGGLRVSLPVGAYTLREGKTRFVSTVDVVGLTAVVLGICFAGGRGIRAVTPVFGALAERIRPRR